jgi:hypothetical protein
MGKVKNTYNKVRHKSSARPTNNGRPFIKRNNGRHDNRVESRDSKYRELAREATVAGDRVAAENYHQHAHHYGRIINAANEAEQERLRLRRQRAEQNELDENTAPVEITANEEYINTSDNSTGDSSDNEDIV